MGERFQRQYATWEDFLKAQGRKEGEEKGELRALKTILLRLLERRFGEVTEGARARVEQAGLDEVTRWMDRVLDTPTIEAIFSAS